MSKKLCEKDVPKLFEFYSDSESMKYRGSKPMLQIDDAYQMISEQNFSDVVTKFRRGIFKKINNELIGTFLIEYNTESPNECEIGFSIGKDYWNKAYGSEILNSILEELRISQQFQKIKAWCVKENQASVKILNKAGFTITNQDKYPKSYLFLKYLQNSIY
ncbi:MAG: GNAT family N-acetyltransferase [Psychroflexus sp.]